jgi:AbrB family looped-hinge helix DNA binding protein
VRINSKGQVTIPQAIREKAGLLPNTEVDFIVENGGVRIVKVQAAKKPSPGTELLRRMRGAPKPKMTTDEILALTRGK